MDQSSLQDRINWLVEESQSRKETERSEKKIREKRSVSKSSRGQEFSLFEEKVIGGKGKRRREEGGGRRVGGGGRREEGDIREEGIKSSNR